MLTLRSRTAKYLSFWIAAAISTGWPRATPAQSTFGRWWWDAAVAAGLRTNDNTVGSSAAGGFEQQDLRLAFGVNGFILHPAIAQFRIGASVTATNVGGDTSFDSKRTGYEGHLSILPSGRYPMTLFAQRAAYDYSSVTTGNPILFLRTPETSSSWGARLRLRTGPLGGTLFGTDSSSVSYAERGAADSTQVRHFIDWSDMGRLARHHFRVERDEQQFGFPDFRFDTWTLTFDQQRPENGHWRWDVNTAAIDRQFAYAGGPSHEVQTARLQNSLAKTLAGGRRQMQFLYEGAMYSAEGGGDYQSHAVTARHTWIRSAALQISPFVRLARQQADAGASSAAQVGLGGSYSRNRPGSRLLVTSSIAALEQQGEGANRGAFAASLTTALGFGSDAGLRRDFEVAFSRNELRSGSEPLTDLPDLGASLNALGTEDYLRTRVSLSHRWRVSHLTFFTDYSQRESSAPSAARGFRIETLSANLQSTLARAACLLNLGQTETTDTTFGLQRVDFIAASGNLRVWRNFSLRAGYRTDDRRFALAPSLSSERWEAGADLRFGEFVVQAYVFETREEFPGQEERRNKGLNATISRATAGWLPWVTGPQRRGVVR